MRAIDPLYLPSRLFFDASMDMVSTSAVCDSKRLVRDSVGSAIWFLKQGVRHLIYAVGDIIKNTVGNMQKEGRRTQVRGRSMNLMA